MNVCKIKKLYNVFYFRNVNWLTYSYLQKNLFIIFKFITGLNLNCGIEERGTFDIYSCTSEVAPFPPCCSWNTSMVSPSSRSGMVSTLSSGLSRFPSKLRRNTNVEKRWWLEDIFNTYQNLTAWRSRPFLLQYAAISFLRVVFFLILKLRRKNIPLL